MGLCCSGKHGSDAPRTTPTALNARCKAWSPRIRAALAWALPITTLALIPKCPACLAGYVLILTGFGVSLPLAGNIRLALIASCVLLIAWLLARAAIAARRRRTPVA